MERKSVSKMGERGKIISGKYKLLIAIILFLSAFIFVLLLSTSTTPLLDGTVTGDSTIFQVIGKYWSKGVLPYTELWDLKGPYIFFINALGYALIESRLGVFVIQVIFMWCSVYLIYKFFCLKCSTKNSLTLSALTLLTLILDYYGNTGNEVEEYCLPLLIGSFYFLYKWTNNVANGEYKHNCVYSLVYGICIGFCLFTRATNALGVCAAVIVVGILLIKKREWKNIFANILAGVVGIVVICIPFIVYFYSKGILYEMWYGTIIYNISYASSSVLNFSSMTMKEIALILLGYSNDFMLVFVGVAIICLDRKRRTAGIMWIMSGLIMLYWMYHSLGSLHYAVVSLPYFCIIIDELISLSRKLGGERKDGL